MKTVAIEAVSTTLDKEEAEEILHKVDYAGWAYLDTPEKGRIFICHSKKNGEYNMGTEQVRWLYDIHECDCLLCCYPAQQWKKRPRISKKLNVLYPNISYIINISFGVSHKLGIQHLLY